MLYGLLLFMSSFVAVLLFGLQSQFVREKRLLTSFITSLCIGMSQLAFFKYVPDATFWQCVFWILGGAFGIVTSIKVHDVWIIYYPHGVPYKYPILTPKPTLENTIRLHANNEGKQL